MTQYSGIFTLPQQAQALTSGKWATDPYFKNTTLLLHADGIPGGAQNNTFIDSSSNAFTITRNGNTTQGTFSPYMPNGYWSNYFDGSGDYLQLGGQAEFAFGTGDFTIELWVYLVATTGTQVFYDSRTNATEAARPVIFQDNGTLYYYVAGTRISAFVFNANTWNHVAVARSGTATKMFLNGTQVGSTYTDTNNYGVGANRPWIGGDGYFTDRNWLNGYTSNLRVIKGTAVYTSNFTPSTAPLTAISGTSLLTCQSNRFLDNSTNAFTVTPAGNVAVQQFQPFMRPYQYSTSVIGGSGYFDGTGDYLEAGSAISLSGDFTVEGWFYAVTWGSYGGIYLYGLGDDSTAGGATFFVYNDGSARIYTSGSNKLSGTGGKFTLNQWVHVAWVRSSGTVKSYVNGVQVDSASSWTNALSGTSYINAERYSGTTYPGGACYISGLRVVTSAVYTSNFTPPTAPLTAITNTSLLCNFTNAGIYDNAMQNNLETVGNAQVSTSVVKYGSGSMYFDGTGDWLVAPNSPQYDLGSGNWTIEAWVYPLTLTNPFSVFCKRANSDADYRWVIGNINSSGAVHTEISTTGSSWAINANTTSTISANQWSHLAWVRNGSDMSVYVNGVKNTLSSSFSGSVYSGTEPLLIGVGGTSGSYTYPANGYIDDLRITKGIARYTSNFQPPQVAFANQ